MKQLNLDCPYVNMFMMCEHFGYEKLSDVQLYLHFGRLVCTH